MSDVQALSRDEIIVGMTQDLIDAGIVPPSPEDGEWADFVFSAAMEFTFRGGDIESVESLGFDAPAEAVRLAHSELSGSDA